MRQLGVHGESSHPPIPVEERVHSATTYIATARWSVTDPPESLRTQGGVVVDAAVHDVSGGFLVALDDPAPAAAQLDVISPSA
jgi:hypothetical protein